ncbi:Uncharacterised protein [Candidatus Tiddalikarchaeum anstoanum]|nr:Uncharacterised protein [Candidatus Tiddalikarchaeum anstoanum]
MYFLTQKVPINGRIRFKCLREKCKKCCKDIFINDYKKFWANKNKIRIPPTSSNNCCIFLNNKNYTCTINKDKPKICKLFPIVSVNKNYVEIAKNCPGIGKGEYMSIKKWIQKSSTNRFEPDYVKYYINYNPLFIIFVLVSIILLFFKTPYSIILFFYPLIWLYTFFRKNSI